MGLEVEKDPTVEKWLQEEFESESTISGYRSSLRHFQKFMEFKTFQKYLESKPDFESDFKRYLSALKDKPSKTRHSYSTIIKVFMREHGFTIDEEKFRTMRRRGKLPRRIRPETNDKAPTKEQLRQILTYADVKMRALGLFLASSGCRIGEALALEMSDINLESNPPEAYIRAGNTKSGLGARTIYFSLEARDAIHAWLAVKPQTFKRFSNRPYATKKDQRVFGFSERNAQFMFANALNKAGLEERDGKTDRRIYHLHGLRKFYRSNIGIKNLDYIHVLMGHSEYLDESYLRVEQDSIRQAYLETMGNVTIFGNGDGETRNKVIALEKIIATQQDRIEQQNQKITEYETNLKELSQRMKPIRDTLQETVPLLTQRLTDLESRLKETEDELDKYHMDDINAWIAAHPKEAAQNLKPQMPPSKKSS